VHGNVWEWMEDCWNEKNAGNPGDGKPRTTGDCNLMLLGSLLSKEDVVRTATPERRALLNTIVADFQKTFTDLRFELRREFRIINAQAIRSEPMFAQRDFAR
jgi:hypothetical protein